mmetsp:Transcript_89125/g.186232  ORF Transcript_89125/g.186232 Transcript_89125/m.186232 type:complete len:88 (+) Transcript_89125:394-657(+)
MWLRVDRGSGHPSFVKVYSASLQFHSSSLAHSPLPAAASSSLLPHQIQASGRSVHHSQTVCGGLLWEVDEGILDAEASTCVEWMVAL